MANGGSTGMVSASIGNARSASFIIQVILSNSFLASLAGSFLWWATRDTTSSVLPWVMVLPV